MTDNSPAQRESGRRGEGEDLQSNFGTWLPILGLRVAHESYRSI